MSGIPANVVWKSKIQQIESNIEKLRESQQLGKQVTLLRKYVNSNGDLTDCYGPIIGLLNLTTFNLFKSDKPPEESDVVIHDETDSFLLDVLSSNRFVVAEAIKYFDISIMRSILRVFQFHCSKSPTRGPDIIQRKQRWKNILYQTYLKFIEHREYLYSTIIEFFQHLVRLLRKPPTLTARSTLPPTTVFHNINKPISSEQLDVAETADPTFLGGFYSVAELLEIVGAIIKGFHQPLFERHVTDLLRAALLPLHVNSVMRDEITPGIAIYHQQLSFCVLEFMKKDASLTKNILLYLLGEIPRMMKTGNNKTSVLLINECEQILKTVDEELFESVQRTFFAFLIQCLENLNFFIAQRALLLLSCKEVLALCFKANNSRLYTDVIPLLQTAADTHWNDTTRQMSYQVLQTMAAMNHPSCRRYFQSYGWQQTQESFKERFEEEEQLEARKQKRMLERKNDITFTSIVFVKKLGEGSYSEVHHVRRIDHGVSQLYWEDYALKVMDKQQLINQHYYEQAQSEIKLLQSTFSEHPNIIRLISKFDSDRGDKIYLLLQFAERGDLFHVLERLGTVDLTYAKYVTIQLCSVLQFIHKKSYVHLDIKPENILITRTGHLKLGDFGSAVQYKNITDSNKSFLQGTAEYTSPWLIQGHAPQPADDVWAVACVLFQLLAGYTPFNGTEKEKLFSDITARTLIFPADFPPSAKALVEYIIHQQGTPLTIEQVMQHAFFEGVNWNDVHSGTPPIPAEGTTKVADIQMELRQRKYSMMLTNALPKQYHFTSFTLEPIIEYVPGDSDSQGD